MTGALAGLAPVADAAGLRVAIFSDALPQRNGTGAYYHDLLAHLSARVEAVEVLQPLPRAGRGALSLPLPGDATQRLVMPNPVRLHRRMARLQPHLVLSVTPGPFGLLGMALARRHRCGFISAFHTHFEALADLYWGRLKGRIVTGALGALNRLICQRSATVLVNNSGLIETVRALGSRRVEVMGTPLEGSFLATPPTAASGRLEKICFAGRLAAEKNIDAVLAAARAWPHLRVVIAGAGPMRAPVEQAAAQCANLDYRGWIDREALCALIDESSLLVLPSHVETFGSIALEAMVRQRPVLVSAHAGIHDWPVVANHLYALAEDEPLSDAIGRLQALPAPHLRAAGRHGRESALRLHHETLDQWVAVLSAHAHASA
jgi:glycosyltransferase involved in cell wall biosynthesis